MNLSQRNRNPGNLRFAGQKESICEEYGFAVFPNDPAGWRALVRQITLDQNRGDTIRKFIEEYAPSHENDTASYVAFVCYGLRAEPEDRLVLYSPYAVAGLIACREGYFAKDSDPPK